MEVVDRENLPPNLNEHLLVHDKECQSDSGDDDRITPTPELLTSSLDNENDCDMDSNSNHSSKSFSARWKETRTVRKQPIRNNSNVSDSGVVSSEDFGNVSNMQSQRGNTDHEGVIDFDCKRNEQSNMFVPYGPNSVHAHQTDRSKWLAYAKNIKPRKPQVIYMCIILKYI